MATTFDPNRVGPGTFQLVRDASTGTYSIQEVGFTKLPSLTLPDLTPTTTTPTPTPTPTPDPDTPDVSQPKLPQVGGGGGGDNQDFTTPTTIRTPDNQIDQAAQISQSLRAFSPDTAEEQFRRQATLPATTGAFSPDTAPQQFRRQATLPEVNENLIDRGNPKGDSRIVSEEQGLTGDAASKFAQARQAMTMPVDYNLPGARSPVPYSNLDPYQQNFLDKAPGFETRVSMLPDVAAPVKTAATQFGVPDAVRLGQPALPDTKITNIIGKTQDAISRAQDVISNKKPVQLMGLGVRMAGKAISGVADAVLGVTEVDRQRQRNAESFFNNVSSKNYKTRGELGSSTDPGRLAGDPSVDLFAGMNKVSAKGNLEKAGAKRIDTRRATIARKGIKSASNPNGVSQEFVNNTNNMEKELDDMRRHNNNENIKSAKKKGVDTSKLNPNEMRNVAETGDPGGDSGGGGKSIVCTAMYQTTGLQDWAKAMKIWYIYQKRYLTIQHQEGYHKLFKPFVKAMHKSNIVKAIGAHFAKHRTQHLKHILFKSKPSMLGKVYSKVLETICYWAGKK